MSRPQLPAEAQYLLRRPNPAVALALLAVGASEAADRAKALAHRCAGCACPGRGPAPVHPGPPLRSR